MTRIQKQRARVISEIAKIKLNREMLDIAKERLEIEKMKVQVTESAEDKLDLLIEKVKGVVGNE